MATLTSEFLKFCTEAATTQGASATSTAAVFSTTSQTGSSAIATGVGTTTKSQANSAVVGLALGTVILAFVFAFLAGFI